MTRHALPARYLLPMETHFVYTGHFRPRKQKLWSDSTGGPRRRISGHGVAHASAARGIWGSRACTATDGRLRGGRSCLVFSTHDRAGEMTRTGGSEVRRRTSGPEEWPTHPARGVCGVLEQISRVSREQHAYIYLRRISAARPRTSYFNFFRLSKNGPYGDLTDTE